LDQELLEHQLRQPGQKYSVPGTFVSIFPRLKPKELDSGANNHVIDKTDMNTLNRADDAVSFRSISSKAARSWTSPRTNRDNHQNKNMTKTFENKVVLITGAKLAGKTR
jgi:hypothetical protein